MINSFVDKSYMHGLPSLETCIVTPRKNLSFFPDIPVYGGIPTNLLLNSIGFVCLVLLFGLLRKKAWNYGRLALLHKTDNRWMELFYGDNETTENNDVGAVEASVNSQLSHIDRGCLSWIVTAFIIPDKELLRRAGPDGLLYVSFQRSLIVLTALMTIVALTVALPINYSGTMRVGNDPFSLTTLSNLDPTSSWMWIHVIIILSYLPIGGFFMRKFIRQVRDTGPAGELTARTLLISEIPKLLCNVEILAEFFKNAFPTLTVRDISLAHDIKRLSVLDTQRDCAKQARLFAENYYKRKRRALKIHPYPGGQVFGCLCKSTDALEFYTAEEIRLTLLVEEEKKAALQRPLGVAFVTLDRPGAAATLRRQLLSSPKVKWSVNFAPVPTDIFWENLSIPRLRWYFAAVSINVIRSVILFFLTTPMTIVSTINKLPIFPETKNRPLISSFLPTVLLVTLAALMPGLVASSESLIRHRTKSGLNSAVLKKTLLLLLFMVLILPSLGLTSAQAFLYWQTFENNTSRWECIFLADQGAFFVNYVITAALTGCALELIRFPELAVYTFRLCLARSRAEQGYVRKAVLREFPMSANYAWLLLVFTVTTVYSTACPLITPFSLLYMVIKHFIDRHNLCFAYRPSVGGENLGFIAATAAGTAPILAQVALLALRLIRRGWSSLTIIQLIGLALSISALIIATMSTTTTRKAKFDLSTADRKFVSPVLQKEYCNDVRDDKRAIISAVRSFKFHKNYGTIQNE